MAREEPYSEREREQRDRYFSRDLAGVPQEFWGAAAKRLVLEETRLNAGDLVNMGFAVNEYLPWHMDIDVFMTPVAHTNFNTNNVDANQIHNGNRSSSGAQNDAINWDIVVGMGSWSFELLHTTANNRGIYTVTLGDIAVGTIDGYSAATTYNVRNSLTFSNAVSGKQRLTLSMKTKNAASANYFGSIQHIQLRRTA